jgi:serine/threonine protein kinase
LNEDFGDSNQAQISLEIFNGQKAIVKRVVHPAVPVLGTAERWMIRREARALKRLSDLEGVPSFLGYPDGNSIAMEYLEGTILREVSSARIKPAYFEQLEALIDEIHHREIVHSDLKKKENLMISPDGNPIVIDFGTHFVRKKGFRPLNNFLYDQFRQMDLNAISKLKEKFCPEEVTDVDRRRLNSPTFLERADQFRRDYLFDF